MHAGCMLYVVHLMSCFVLSAWEIGIARSTKSPRCKSGRSVYAERALWDDDRYVRARVECIMELQLCDQPVSKPVISASLRTVIFAAGPSPTHTHTQLSSRSYICSREKRRRDCKCSSSFSLEHQRLLKYTACCCCNCALFELRKSISSLWEEIFIFKGWFFCCQWICDVLCALPVYCKRIGSIINFEAV